MPGMVQEGEASSGLQRYRPSTWWVLRDGCDTRARQLLVLGVGDLLGWRKYTFSSFCTVWRIVSCAEGGVAGSPGGERRSTSLVFAQALHKRLTLPWYTVSSWCWPRFIGLFHLVNYLSLTSFCWNKIGVPEKDLVTVRMHLHSSVTCCGKKNKHV